MVTVDHGNPVTSEPTRVRDLVPVAPGQGASEPPPTDWDALVAQVLCGRQPKRVADIAGVSVWMLRAKARAAREAAEAGHEPDWPALIARVEAGESKADVSEEAGVSTQRLWGKMLAARKAAAKATVADSPPVTTAGPEPVDAVEAELEVAAPARSVAPAPAGAAWAAEANDDNGWAPGDDVTMLTRYAMGESSYDISQKLRGRTPADVAKRFKQLVPHASIDAQRKALDAARKRAGYPA